ncbi:MAG: UDP-N-acetylmuramoyl-L-alanyl-D-glutamate--2,6-diaminopimelate ligase [Rhodocyclaceae bacterium]|nr:UDP-N-acetylmuramoyl-L-alanyl-D-glutamate--2,6-diaminopimelate ligase [Rhodocyclaceae bacterium]
MHMSVPDILAALRTAGVPMRRLAADSRRVGPGDVFLAYPGELNDGRQYIETALERGAAAVIYEASGADIGALDVPQIAVENLRHIVAPLAAEVYGNPSRQLWLAGVTGTNGKTSVSQWLAESFKQLGKRCAIVGTLGNGYPGALVPSPNTTPNALSLQQALSDFVADEADACVMEVSSIGIEEGRVDATRFAVAVFTNFTRDHLDYHGSMEAYAAAKMRLFDWPDLKAAVINLDDPFGLQILAHINRRIPCIGYTLNSVKAPVDEYLSAERLLMDGSGLSFEVNGLRLQSRLIGRFNASNVLAVIAALRAYGIGLQDAVRACAGLLPPPGRMQTLGGEADRNRPLVVVDYAHTPDALEKVLQTLREVAAARGGRLHCVFGCGGDRDAGKRPLMGAVAERHADATVVTSDNPRNEEPAAIIAAIVSGMSAATAIVPDRADAIRTAIAGAGAADVVLLAGKGHEDYQEIRGQKLPFSDLAEAAKALEARP